MFWRAPLVAEEVYPTYEALIAQQEALLPRASHDAGIWRIPNGEAIYADALKSNTTTDMTADEIHRLGLAEVARIEEAMARAPAIFVTILPQPVEIVRIPEFSEDSAPGGYYEGPALDGSRPGRFYINLKDTADNPRWTLPTLLYHEAAPGHHFQISRATLIEDVPFLRKFSPFSAYNEGWALYAEKLAAEDIGLYADDPMGDLGRLQAEMFRAVRLVVDTGMHAKRWSREEAIDYMAAKTGMTLEEVTREIERYVVWPGQATAYKSGQLAIIRMREDAEGALGDKFDLRAFNEAILENGSMPLGVLEERMTRWTTAQAEG